MPALHRCETRESCREPIEITGLQNISQSATLCIRVTGQELTSHGTAAGIKGRTQVALHDLGPAFIVLENVGTLSTRQVEVIRS